MLWGWWYRDTETDDNKVVVFHAIIPRKLHRTSCNSPKNNLLQLSTEQLAATLQRTICCNSPQKNLQIPTEPSTSPKKNLLQFSTENSTNLYWTQHLSKEQSVATLHRKTYKSLQNPPPLQRIVCNSPQKNMCTVFKEHDLPHSLTPGNSCCRCNKQAMILEVSTSCSLAQLTYAQTLWLFLNQSAASTCFWITSSENFPPPPTPKNNNQEALSHEVGRLE